VIKKILGFGCEETVGRRSDAMGIQYEGSEMTNTHEVFTF
jgi:hypothetical protein